MQRERRDDQHLACVARPHDEKERMVADEVLRRRVERREAEPGEQKDRERAPRFEILERPHDALDRRAEVEVDGRRFAHAVIADSAGC